MKTLDLILTSLPSKFQDINSPGKLSENDVIAGALKQVTSPLIKKPRRKVYQYQKGAYCKFGNFREGFIFAKLRICEVS